MLLDVSCISFSVCAAEILSEAWEIDIEYTTFNRKCRDAF